MSIASTRPTEAISQSGTDNQVVVASSALPAGAATDATLAAVLTTADFDTKSGSLTETAPTTDIASSGLNGRLQRIAQRLTTLIASAVVAATRFANLGASNTLNIKSSAGVVISLYCHNANAADRFIQLHNTATVPAGGATPLYTFRVPAGGDVLIGTDFFTLLGATFSTGIAFAFSTSINTLTLGVAGDQTTLVEFI